MKNNLNNLQKMIFLLILSLGLFGLAPYQSATGQAQSSEAATIYVDNTTTSCSTPSDIDYDVVTKTCGAGAAIVYSTIQGAASAVAAGDTVNVRAGTYNERISFTRSGSSGAYITFQPYTGETVYLDGTGLGNGVMFQGLNVSYVKVIGLKIRNYVGAGIHFQPNVSNGFSGSHIEIRDNEIYNGTFSSGFGHAILVVTWPWGSTNAYTDIIVDGNYIHDVVTGVDGGYNEALTLAGLITRFQITNNIIDNAKYIGVDLIGRGSQFPSNGIVANNTVRNSCKIEAASGIYVDGAKNVLIESNKVYNNGGNGVVVSAEEAAFVTENVIVRKNQVWNNIRNILIGSTYNGTARHNRFVHNTALKTTTGNQANYPLYKTDNNIVKNNISYNTITNGYHIANWYGAITNTTLNYNNYYSSNLWFHYSGKYYAGLSAFKSGTGQDANSIGLDPKFTDIANNDFTLLSDSPCINAGDFLTRTTSSGTGTVIPVADARYFHNGYGITGVSGDTIRVGSNTVTVTDVNYSTNTLTVTPSISWGNGDGVSYSYSGSKPDIGAYEYQTTGDTTPPAAPSGLSVQ